MSNKDSNKYYVPHLATWPIVGATGMTLTAVGAATFMNSDTAQTPVLMYLGFAVLIFMFFGWLGLVIKESENSYYNPQVDGSFRIGMVWFIFSEVMFFAGFFMALWYVRNLAVPWLGGEGTGIFTNSEVWKGFEGAWPTNGPGNIGGEFELVDPYHLPLINTVLLMASSITLTIAHHALIAGKRTRTIGWLIATVLLGATFLFYQASEYIEAYHELNLTLGSGIYGSTFFMLTGFHGMHVTLGAIMLTVITIRMMRGHFKPESHFGFEAVAWYWHFVDVVWLGLFIFVYII